MDAHTTLGRARRTLAVLAAATTLPYLALKTLWLTGSRVGIAGPEFGHSSTLLVANALTAGLDLVALLLAVALFRGTRLPAWLLLPPMWIGAGLLGQIVATVPLMLQAAGPSRPSTGGIPPLEPWVYVLVYGGFAGLGIGLLGSFAAYAAQRWPRRPDADATRPTPVATALLRAAAAVCVLAGLLHVALSDVPTATAVTDLLVALLAAGALLILSGRPLSRAAVVVAFVATGALAAWGAYLGLLTLFPNELTGRTEVHWPTVVGSAARVLAGTLGALALSSQRPLTRG